MLEKDYIKIIEIITEHIGEELQEYNSALNTIFNLDKDTSMLILTNFLSMILCKRKIMLKKEDTNYELEEYQRN